MKGLNTIVIAIIGLALLSIISNIIVGKRYDSEIKQLEYQNDSLLYQIELRDSIVVSNLKTIDSITVQRERVKQSIKKMMKDHEKISDEFKSLYLNPDSTDWSRLDSLSTIILQRESRL